MTQTQLQDCTSWSRIASSPVEAELKRFTQFKRRSVVLFQGRRIAETDGLICGLGDVLQPALVNATQTICI